MSHDVGEVARELLEVVPTVSRFIRTEMRSHRALGLSVPQFRTLAYIERTGGTSLGSVAEHLGLTPPSACKIVDGLEARGLAVRMHFAGDRRRVNLQITPAGRRDLADARRETQKSLAKILSLLDSQDLGRIMLSMGALRTAFVEERVNAHT